MNGEIYQERAAKVKGVRYSLTAHGHSLDPVFSQLWEWGTGHLRRASRRGTKVAPPR